MVAVPAVNPVTTPPLLTVATAGFEVVHVPVPPSARVVVNPAHTLGVPVMMPGKGRTVTVAVAFVPPQGDANT
jgi:hypothetical protein